MSEFEGKIALVTGGSTGIGRATALAFARKGARVVIADIAAPKGEQTAQMVADAGGEARFVRVDVSSAADVEALVGETVETYGRLDYACNHAGIAGVSAPTGEYPEDACDRVIGVNLTGVFLCMKHESWQMLRQEEGAIVNVSSILAHVGFANASAYVAALHAGTVSPRQQRWNTPGAASGSMRSVPNSPSLPCGSGQTSR